MKKITGLLLLLAAVMLTAAEETKIKYRTFGNAQAALNSNKEIVFTAQPGAGWPQLQLLDVPVKAGANKVYLNIKLVTPEKSTVAIKIDSPIKNAIQGEYFHTQLKNGKAVLLSFNILKKDLKNLPLRISCKSPKVKAEYVISNVHTAVARSLAEGWGFEDNGDCGKVLGNAEISTEYAYRGKKSLKMVFTGAQDQISIYPDITDWSKYKELRFTIYNPQPHPNRKSRVLQLNGKYLPTTCSITSGLLAVQPESNKEFVLDLDTLPPSIDRKKIIRINIYKGNPNTVFYLDNMKLYTYEEVEELKKKQGQGRVRQVLDEVNAALKLDPVDPAALLASKKQLESLLAAGILQQDRKLEALFTAAREQAVLAKALHGEKASLVLRGVPATERIFRDEEFTHGKKQGIYQLSAAGNERESFQIVVMAQRELKKLTVTASDLVSADGKKIDSKNVLINPVGYIELQNADAYPSSRNGYWPEVLQHNRPLDIGKRLQPYWITVYVPYGQPAGLYKGNVTFFAANGVKNTFEYQLKVRNFSLPVKGECLTFFDWRYTPKDPKVRRRCYDMMLDCRLNPTSMYVNGNAPDGVKVPYQYNPHPDDLEHCLKRGMNMLCIWYLYNPAQPFVFDEAYLSKFKKFISHYRPILEKYNAWDMTIINGFDEIMHQDPPEVAKRLKEANKICSWLKRDYAGIKICNVGRKMDISTKLMDVWFMGGLPESETRDIVDNGGKVCFYWVYGNPSPMLDLPGIAARMMAWQAFKHRAAGIAYYSTYRNWAFDLVNGKAPQGIDWSCEEINSATHSSRKSKNHRPNRHGDGNLFWPDADGGVLASTRVHNVRDGVEDYEYLAMLRKLDKNHPLLTIPDKITTLEMNDYTKDYNYLNNYREQLAAAIEKLSAANKQ